jgi:hypothetical protein
VRHNAEWRARTWGMSAGTVVAQVGDCSGVAAGSGDNGSGA